MTLQSQGCGVGRKVETPCSPRSDPTRFLELDTEHLYPTVQPTPDWFRPWRPLDGEPLHSSQQRRTLAKRERINRTLFLHPQTTPSLYPSQTLSDTVGPTRPRGPVSIPTRDTKIPGRTGEGGENWKNGRTTEKGWWLGRMGRWSLDHFGFTLNHSSLSLLFVGHPFLSSSKDSLTDSRGLGGGCETNYYDPDSDKGCKEETFPEG